ncbi:putative tetratricopeptide-like helical domain superfamily [Arabidopsis thaliana]|uniref:NDP1 n=2 Tax=Arabidopsis TaxID=3701 RepID=A0A178UD62_ARATH|nr:Tetratricopeptide-like helical domain superfamily [Arabidopsis thaliana x Arabidopsis arenosa]OAO91589.1 NDP1 [Arabidopsis thaliana]
MIRAAAKFSREAAATFRGRTISVRGNLIRYSTPLRLIHGEISVPNANHVAIQMVNYALSHARSQKSDESYAQGMLVLEQCLGNQPNDDQVSHDSKATVLLAMSDLLYESGNSSEAIERLKQVMILTHSSLAIRVVAVEALVGLLIQSGQDDASLDVADEFLKLVKESGHENLQGVVATVKAIKGLAELVKGNIESAESLFRGLENHESCKGNIALSYGEYLHATGNFELAKEMYQKAIQGVTETKESMCSCNMNLKAVSLAATFALGQLESHIGNFGVAEKTLTDALTKTEEHYGDNHPKVGVILTAVALMYGNKAKQERSSSILIQEGLYRKALELMKAPPLDSKGIINMENQEVIALARAGYAELLLIQENRKSEGEKMNSWAESAWRNKRISLSEALTLSEPLGKVAIIDARTTRVL